MVLYVRIGVAAQLLGVCTKTLRRWERAGKIHGKRTVGGHRRIAILEIRRLQGEEGEKEELMTRGQTAIYARVSSHEQKQKGDLKRQVKVAEHYCRRETETTLPIVFTDVASGLKQDRRGLQRLCRAVEQGTIDRVIVTYPDRLTRFGFQYLQRYFQSHGVSIICLHQPMKKNIQETLVTDLIAIVTSFSGRVHGLRSHKNKKKLPTSA